MSIKAKIVWQYDWILETSTITKARRNNGKQCAEAEFDERKWTKITRNLTIEIHLRREIIETRELRTGLCDMKIRRRETDVIDDMVETSGAVEGDEWEAQIEEEDCGHRADRVSQKRGNGKSGHSVKNAEGHIKQTDKRVDGKGRRIDE